MSRDDMGGRGREAARSGKNTNTVISPLQAATAVLSFKM